MTARVTDEDRALSHEFCDAIGCTAVHHLRDELPAFVATIRAMAEERIAPKGHSDAYGLPTTIQEAVEEVRAWREASETIGYVTPDGLRTNIIALQRDLSNVQARYATLKDLTIASLEKAEYEFEHEIERSTSALRAMQESTRDTCGSVAKALGYEGPDDGDALVAKARAVVAERDSARSEAKVWHEQSDRWERAATEARREVNLALDEKNEIAKRLGDALRWYADERNWKGDLNEYDEWIAPVDSDRGDLARKVLEGGST